MSRFESNLSKIARQVTAIKSLRFALLLDTQLCSDNLDNIKMKYKDPHTTLLGELV